MSKPIPVEAARRISEDSDLTHVVVVGFDERENMFQCATFGARDERDKLNAAVMGESIIASLGGGIGRFPPHEDFRNPLRAEIAALKAQRGELLKAVKRARRWFNDVENGAPALDMRDFFDDIITASEAVPKGTR